jgi:hypothetical protein
MQAQQAHLLFRVTGKQALRAPARVRLRPALLARYRDLTSLRYDFPLVLSVRDGEESVQSLSGLMDRAFGSLADHEDSRRLRIHGLRIEREIRRLAAASGSSSLFELWDRAAIALAAEMDGPLRDSFARLRTALDADGEIVDCDSSTAWRVSKHAWKPVQDEKARTFAAEIGQLIQKLSDLLRADFVRSGEGLGPERLAASVGGTQRELFDFAAMSRLLGEAFPDEWLSESRRNRLRRLLSVLQSQRFFALEGGRHWTAGALPYEFVFESWADAAKAYRERLPRMRELAKAVAMARLEAAGEFDAKHDALFQEFDGRELESTEADAFPSYLVRLAAAEQSHLHDVLEALAAGFPAKVLVETDDLVETSSIGGEPTALGSHSRQIAGAALGLGSFHVVQSGASHLFQFRQQMFRALGGPGPALLVVFSGAIPNGLPPYLNAAMAMESRAFPAFTYDPSAGPDWASRFSLEGNPQPERDWPVFRLEYEDAEHQRAREDVAFTFADFLAADPRYVGHFSEVPRQEWESGMVPISEFCAGGEDDRLPYVLTIDEGNRLRRAIVDDGAILQTRRCAGMWRSLQELGGLHNSYAERLLAEERKKWTQQSAGQAEPAPEVAAAPADSDQAAEVPIESARGSDDPWIETPRCTSCNECIQINNKMFGYDSNKQASIVNPDAGSYRQLVEAAESCQVSIVHPGKPRNPQETGLDELRERAAPFL